jgi:hypothetical protein
MDKGSNKYTTTYADGENYPIAIFKFRYRSKKDFRAMLSLDESLPPEKANETDPVEI